MKQKTKYNLIIILLLLTLVAVILTGLAIGSSILICPTLLCLNYSLWYILSYIPAIVLIVLTFAYADKITDYILNKIKKYENLIDECNKPIIETPNCVIENHTDSELLDEFKPKPLSHLTFRDIDINLITVEMLHNWFPDKNNIELFTFKNISLEYENLKNNLISKFTFVFTPEDTNNKTFNDLVKIISVNKKGNPHNKNEQRTGALYNSCIFNFKNGKIDIYYCYYTNRLTLTFASFDNYKNLISEVEKDLEKLSNLYI